MLRTARTAVILLAAVAATALPASPARANGYLQTFEQKLIELDKALFAPRGVKDFEPIDETSTCDELSLEVTALVPASRSYRPSFYDDPVNGAIIALGMTFTSAFYMLGIPEYARYREERHHVNARDRIGELRDAMADRLCYTY